MLVAYSDNKGIEENSRDVKRSLVSPEVELGRLEVVRGAGQAKQCNKTVGCDGGYSTGRHERGESNGTGQDSAQDGSAKDIHDDDGVSGLAILVHLTDPLRAGEHTVAGDSENESRGCYNSDACVLRWIVSSTTLL